ncbi:MAG: polysaccharide deacetylase family protein [Clostridiales bacterium]
MFLSIIFNKRKWIKIGAGIFLLLLLLPIFFLFSRIKFWDHQDQGAISSAEKAAADQEDLREQAALLVLLYHHLDENEDHWGPYAIPPRQFEYDLQYLVKNNYEAVTLKEIIDFVYHQGKLPAKPVLITFDDGYESNYVYAWPLLKKYNMKAVINIIGILSDQESAASDHNVSYSYLTWDQIIEMQESGIVEFGNHTYDLHSKNRTIQGIRKKKTESIKEYQQRLMEDLELTQKKLMTACGSPALCFAFPLGIQEEHALPILDELGFQVTLCSHQIYNELIRNQDCLRPLGRFNRAAGINTVDFFARIEKNLPVINE